MKLDVCSAGSGHVIHLAAGSLDCPLVWNYFTSPVMRVSLQGLATLCLPGHFGARRLAYYLPLPNLMHVLESQTKLFCTLRMHYYDKDL